jgi:hypothetical protein
MKWAADMVWLHGRLLAEPRLGRTEGDFQEGVSLLLILREHRIDPIVEAD